MGWFVLAVTVVALGWGMYRTIAAGARSIQRDPHRTITVHQFRESERLEIDRQNRELDVRVAQWDAAKIAGEIEGQHYTKWVPVIEQMKRDDDITGALALTLECIDASERQAKIDRLGIPPAYTRHAAILYRKVRDYPAEVAIIERYLEAGGQSSELRDRLEKARGLRDR